MVIWVVFGNHPGAIELFSKDKTDQLVREDELRQGEHVVGPGTQGIIDTVGTADHEDDAPRTGKPGAIVCAERF